MNVTLKKTHNLLFYSDQGLPRGGGGDGLDTILLSLLADSSLQIGYIPSASDTTRRYFQRVQEHYRDLGLYDVEYFDLGTEFSAEPNSEALSRLLSCAVVHLSGGDTTEFLALLQRRNFLSVLRRYVNNGGILLGVSAGAMLMCPDIGLCRYFDECKVKLKSEKALGLVEFEFFPHFDGAAKTVKKLCEHSLRSSKTIYACHDTEGLWVQGDKLVCVGNPLVIEKGKARDFL